MKAGRTAVLLVSATLTIASHGIAQNGGPSQAPAASEAMTDKARDLYNEGRKFYSDDEYDKAHASLLAAWSLKKHWQIAGMLGLCEVKMKRYRDAAEHLTFAIRTGAGSASAAELKRMQEGLATAKREVGMLKVQVDTDEAEVRINGHLVGSAPLIDPLFVNAGEHVLMASTPTRSSADVKVTVGAGTMMELVLRVDQVTEDPPERPDAGTVAPAGDAGPAPEAGEDSQRSLTPAIIGGAVALVGLGVGVGFTMSASGKESDRDDIADTIGGGDACGPSTPFTVQCQEIQDLDDQAGTRRNIALGGFVVGGLALAGTAAYLLWPSSEGSSDAARLTPVVGPSGGGLQFRGSF